MKKVIRDFLANMTFQKQQKWIWAKLNFKATVNYILKL